MVDEDRYIAFGVSSKRRLLVVAHTESQVVVRIMNPRRKVRAERKIYEETLANF